MDSMNGGYILKSLLFVDQIDFMAVGLKHTHIETESEPYYTHTSYTFEYTYEYAYITL